MLRNASKYMFVNILSLTLYIKRNAFLEKKMHIRIECERDCLTPLYLTKQYKLFNLVFKENLFISCQARVSRKGECELWEKGVYFNSLHNPTSPNIVRNEKTTNLITFSITVPTGILYFTSMYASHNAIMALTTSTATQLII